MTRSINMSTDVRIRIIFALLILTAIRYERLQIFTQELSSEMHAPKASAINKSRITLSKVHNFFGLHFYETLDLYRLKTYLRKAFIRRKSTIIGF